MKLTTENIQFIDNYLKNSEVIYYDIRMEMLDHVATAVEQKMEAENLDFYEAFKSYMVVNKKGLMKQNERTLKHDFKAIFPFLKFNISLNSLLTFTLLGLLFYFLLQEFETITISKFLVNFIFIGMGLFYLKQTIFYFYRGKKRFHYLEKNSVILFVLYQPILMLNSLFLLDDKSKPPIIVALILFLFSGLFINFVFYDIVKQRQISKSKLVDLK